MQMSGWFDDIASALPGIVTAGATLYTALSPPAGVTPSNPYALPSGLNLPPGVTPGYQTAYGYPAAPQRQASLFSDPLTLSLLAGGAILLIVLMKR